MLGDYFLGPQELSYVVACVPYKKDNPPFFLFKKGKGRIEVTLARNMWPKS